MLPLIGERGHYPHLKGYKKQEADRKMQGGFKDGNREKGSYRGLGPVKKGLWLMYVDSMFQGDGSGGMVVMLNLPTKGSLD